MHMGGGGLHRTHARTGATRAQGGRESNPKQENRCGVLDIPTPPAIRLPGPNAQQSATDNPKHCADKAPNPREKQRQCRSGSASTMQIAETGLDVLARHSRAASTPCVKPQETGTKKEESCSEGSGNAGTHWPHRTQELRPAP